MIFTVENLQGTNYVKKWQSNGYYPVEKIQIIDNKMHVSDRKLNSDGILEFRQSRSIYEIDYYLYVLNHNSYKFTTDLSSNNFN